MNLEQAVYREETGRWYKISSEFKTPIRPAIRNLHRCGRRMSEGICFTVAGSSPICDTPMLVAGSHLFWRH